MPSKGSSDSSHKWTRSRRVNGRGNSTLHPPIFPLSLLMSLGSWENTRRVSRLPTVQNGITIILLRSGRELWRMTEVSSDGHPPLKCPHGLSITLIIQTRQLQTPKCRMRMRVRTRIRIRTRQLVGNPSRSGDDLLAIMRITTALRLHLPLQLQLNRHIFSRHQTTHRNSPLNLRYHCDPFRLNHLLRHPRPIQVEVINSRLSGCPRLTRCKIHKRALLRRRHLRVYSPRSKATRPTKHIISNSRAGKQRMLDHRRTTP